MIPDPQGQQVTQVKGSPVHVVCCLVPWTLDSVWVVLA